MLVQIIGAFVDVIELTYLVMYGLINNHHPYSSYGHASQHGLLKLLGNRESLNSVGVADRAEKTVQNCRSNGTSCTRCYDVDLGKFIHVRNSPRNAVISDGTYSIRTVLYCWFKILQDRLLMVGFYNCLSVLRFILI